MTGPLFLLIRAAAALGGAFLGWLVAGPAVRTLFRVAFQRPAPGWLVPVGKFTGAGLVAALVFFFLPLGGGEGWGWGPGFGIGPSKGDGAGPSTPQSPGDSKGDKKDAKPTTATRDTLEIELLGGARVTSEGRYYLMKRQPPAKTLSEVENDVKEQADKLEIHLVFTDDSVATTHPAAGRLRELLRQHRIPIVETQGK